MKKLVGAVVALGVVMTSGVVLAQEKWPTKTIKLVVPYAPGGYTDAVGRITARFLEKELGQTVVENRAGAGGIVGTDLVSKSKPDGYTLCICSVGAVSVAPVAQKNVQYDPLKDLAPISIVSVIPQTVIVNPKVPVKSLEELIDYAKKNPGGLDYGSSGAGGLMHFSVELFQSKTGTKMTHVPFGGGAPATAAVVAGEVDLTFTNMTDALPQIEANTVRALAVTSAKRSPYAPDLPTVAEAAVPGFSAESWNGVIAPAGTPDAIIKRVSEALAKMAEDPEVKEAMAKIGATPVFTTPEDYKSQIKQEVEQWKAVIAEIEKKG